MKKTHKNDELSLRWRWIAFGCIWAFLIILCIRYRKELSLENIVAFTPKSPIFAAFVMLAFFALKSLSMVFYNGILYAADGIMFSIPSALALNIVGTSVMVSIPYMIGKKTGSSMMHKLVEKYPKVKKIREIRTENNLIFILFIRFVGIAPCDVVSLYMGAIDMPYPVYLLGCIFGMLPQIIIMTFMGTGMENIHSRSFGLAVAAKATLMVISFFTYWIYKKVNPQRK